MQKFLTRKNLEKMSKKTIDLNYVVVAREKDGAARESCDGSSRQDEGANST